MKPDIASRTWWLNVIAGAIAVLTIIYKTLGGGEEIDPILHEHETVDAVAPWLVVLIVSVANCVLRYLTDQGIRPFWGK